MSTRLEKVKRLIQRELAEILLRENDFGRDILITLTRVDVSDDLRSAAAYISVSSEEKTKEVFKTLRDNIYEIQQKLNRRMRTRPVPKLRFVEEKKVREAAKIEALLEKINNVSSGGY